MNPQQALGKITDKGLWLSTPVVLCKSCTRKRIEDSSVQIPRAQENPATRRTALSWFQALSGGKDTANWHWWQNQSTWSPIPDIYIRLPAHFVPQSQEGGWVEGAW